jgi:universal stress protein A
VSITYAHEAYIQALPDLQAQLETTARRQLIEFSAGVDAPHKNLHVLEGPPSVSICEYADKIGADLIVLGSHGASGWRVILGSTANSVVQRAICDVLTVRIEQAEADK